MRIIEKMKIYDSNGKNGIIEHINGDELEVTIEDIITISFNSHMNKEIQKVNQNIKYNINDIGSKLFFSLEDISLTYEEIIEKPEYKEYIESILIEKEIQEKKNEEKIKSRVGNLPLLTKDLLDKKQKVYLSKERSTTEEDSYLQEIKNEGLMSNEPFFARMDCKLEHEDMAFYEKIYIGKSAISSGGRYYVYDWRAPVCSRYYLKNEVSFIHKDDFYDWVFRYELLLRRAYKFKDIKFEFNNEYIFGDVKYDGITDPFLMDVLTEKSLSGKLTDIIKTIQANQNNIIRSNINENIIVQGCAGSGKTMILLHRLSYLLFNNKNININLIRIISPNSIFDNHINELAKELELDKIQKGTIEEYYIEKLRLYKLISKTEQVKYNVVPATQGFDYFYSEIYEKVLKEAFNKWQLNIELNLNEVLQLAKQFDVELVKTNSIQAKLNSYKDIINKIFERNREVKKELFLEYIDLLPDFRELNREEESKLYQIVSEKNINSKFAQEIKSILATEGLTNNKIKDYLEIINNIISRISIFCNDGKSISMEFLSEFFKEDVNTLDIKMKQKIRKYRIKFYKALGFSLANSDFQESVQPRVLNFFKRSRSEFVDNIKWPNLEEEILGQESIATLKQFSAKIPTDMAFVLRIYYPLRDEVLKNLHLEKRNEGLYKFDMVGLLYLSNLYAGPLRIKDTLLNIDEGQDISLLEYKLLNNINGNQVVFNIYGDNNQLIKEIRGISNWDSLDIKPFKYYELNENYRNTIQITEYCNQQFGYKTTPIGLNGRKVKVEKYESNLAKIISNFLTEEGSRKAIIVKDAEAISRIFLDKSFNKQNEFNFVVSNESKIDKNKINVFIVQMAKGLEFDNVLVIDSNMTKNEKYIALTRALSFVTYSNVL